MIKKVGLFLFLISTAFLSWLVLYSVGYMRPSFDPLDNISPVPKQPITLALVGDIMLDRGVANSVKKNFNGDFSKIFENVPELKLTDITFGNLEGPITTSNNRRGSIYSFKMDPTVAGVLSEAGFDVVSFANNHIGDYGQIGFNDTLKYLNENNILYAGAGINIEDASITRIINVRGKKIGFLGFTDVGPNWMAAKENTPGILLASNPDFERIITREKEMVDYLVVSFHWGDEYKPATDRQKDLAIRAVSAGADVIVGHHPHVIQEDTVINGKPVLFSLGNFVFDQSSPPQTKTGLIAVISFNPDNTISLDKFSSDRDSTFRPQAPRDFEESDVISIKEDEIKKVAFVCPKPKEKQLNLSLISFPRPEPIEGYIPKDLVLIPKEYTITKNVCITNVAYGAFKNLSDDMKKQGLVLLVRYGFRDNDLQESLVSSFAENGKSSFVAPVGQSEHVLGMAFDFASGTSSGSFVASKEYQYLKANAYKYGFVQSYKGDSGGKTMIPNEPWHWRYVGKNLALAIKSSGLPTNLFLNSY